MKVGVFDSGKGGTTVLAAIERELPDVEYKYIADSKNCPYGEKSDAELMQIVERHVENLRDWGAKIIVIACNTATTRCIEEMRKRYPDLLFVGTEPAIKMAAGLGAKKVLVMATPGTVAAERTMRLLEENRNPGQEIDLLACVGLADAIERGIGVRERLGELLDGIEQDIQVVVLGCTHYSLIKTEIQKYLPGAKLIDGNEGVAKRVRELVRQIEVA
ncbi:MAG: glutamate racemase [Candidatus Saccharibacteria bacterium]|nr:glutamate racemase [Candidatus Saccharibacteria bacterium]